MAKTFEQRWDAIDRWVRRNSKHLIVERMLEGAAFKDFQHALTTAHASKDIVDMKAAERASRKLQALWDDE